MRIFLAAVMVSASALGQTTLPPQFANWDGFVEQELKRWHAPGVSIAIVKGGQVILSRGYGWRDLERQLPMTEMTVQPIASVTKSFTVASLATLVRDGKIEWDKPVREVLPDFRMHSDYATQTLTVRDLVTHRSGLPRHDFAWFGSAFTREQLYKRLRHFELSAEPRTRFQYNNLMFMTAGYLGGRVAGTDWESLVRQSLFEPLGMASSSFTIEDLRKAPDHATGYSLDDDERPVARPYQGLVAMGPTGSINSNARDMAQALLMYTQGGRYQGKTIIAPPDLRAMSTGQFTLPDPQLWPERSAPQYGMGFFLANYRGVPLVEHGGNMPGSSTAFAFVPSRGVGVYATVNVSGSFLRDVIMYAAIDRLLELPPVDWSGRFRDIFEGNRAAQKAARAMAAPKPAAAAALPLDEYIGDYEHEGYGVITIGRGDSNAPLVIRFNGFSAPLVHLRREVFQSPRNELGEFSEARVQFVSDLAGEINALRTEFEPAVKPIEFRRLPDARFKDRAYLASLEGRYAISVSEWTVRLRADGMLELAGRTGAPMELIGVRGHKFDVKGQSGFQVEFVPDAQGRMAQMLLHRSGSSALATRR